jgi:hypothetical protein
MPHTQTVIARNNKVRHRPALDRATQYSRALMMIAGALQYWATRSPGRRCAPTRRRVVTAEFVERTCVTARPPKS